MIKDSEQITEKMMSSKEFIDSIEQGNNLGAEKAFSDAMSAKVGDTLEAKRKELSKAFVTSLEKEVEENE